MRSEIYGGGGGGEMAAKENPIDSTEPTGAESGSDKSRIGLCLSGGGFRASFFHLGTLRYLEEVGIMEKVEVVSTVSGGSIIGAYYLGPIGPPQVEIQA